MSERASSIIKYAGFYCLYFSCSVLVPRCVVDVACAVGCSNAAVCVNRFSVLLLTIIYRLLVGFVLFCYLLVAFFGFRRCMISVDAKIILPCFMSVSCSWYGSYYSCPFCLCFGSIVVPCFVWRDTSLLLALRFVSLLRSGLSQLPCYIIACHFPSALIFKHRLRPLSNFVLVAVPFFGIYFY